MITHTILFIGGSVLLVLAFLFLTTPITTLFNRIAGRPTLPATTVFRGPHPTQTATPSPDPWEEIPWTCPECDFPETSPRSVDRATCSNGHAVRLGEGMAGVRQVVPFVPLDLIESYLYTWAQEEGAITNWPWNDRYMRFGNLFFPKLTKPDQVDTLRRRFTYTASKLVKKGILKPCVRVGTGPGGKSEFGHRTQTIWELAETEEVSDA